ncbi:haloacid dehalogenase-like hydrolase [Hymenobacter caeli]|uniref:Phosphoserine phosphatase n=1 Tax=Hymenobacter caeli TaxID=2735894 RepID=A0ABX2FLA1_9BACT|nr:haloacid dehalogenase-like hydrolase [Hymenobacter caeli]NRT17285.1 phosphoserine phosphatase [Hymenobacter caeli]
MSAAKMLPPADVDVFVFDVCDTLFYSNTTFDYLNYVLEQKQLGGRRRWLQLLTKRWSPAYLGLAVWQKLAGGDAIKAAALRLLVGIPKEELYALGRSFLKDFLGTRKIARTHELLASSVGSRTRVVLISASLDPIIAALAVALEVEFVSSELDYDGRGRCTGRLRREMSGQKHHALRELAGADLRLAVATDNFTDRALVAGAAYRYVVVHRPADKPFWQDLGPQFIEAYSA